MKAGISGGRDFEASAKILWLKDLEPSSRAAALFGPKTLIPSAVEIVGDARDQRRLWANHDEFDAVRLAKSGDRRMVLYVERRGMGKRGNTGVARRDIERFQQRALCERNGDGMLASAGAKKKNIHDRFV